MDPKKTDWEKGLLSQGRFVTKCWTRSCFKGSVCYDCERVMLTCSGLVHKDGRMSPKKCLWSALKLDLNFETQPFGVQR